MRLLEQTANCSRIDCGKVYASMQIVLSSYTIIGLTLLILAGSAALYLLRLADKSKATWALIIFEDRYEE